MDIDSWKEKSDEERELIIRNQETFNAYSNEANILVRSLGKELSKTKGLNTDMVGVLNRFGELIIHLHVPLKGCSKLEGVIENYFGFRVFFSKESAWFNH